MSTSVAKAKVAKWKTTRWRCKKCGVTMVASAKWYHRVKVGHDEGYEKVENAAHRKPGDKALWRRKPPQWKCDTCGQEVSDASYHRATYGHQSLTKIATGAKLGARPGPKKHKIVAVSGSQGETDDTALKVKISYAAGWMSSWIAAYAEKCGIPESELRSSLAALLEGGE